MGPALWPALPGSVALDPNRKKAMEAKLPLSQSSRLLPFCAPHSQSSGWIRQMWAQRTIPVPLMCGDPLRERVKWSSVNQVLYHEDANRVSSSRPKVVGTVPCRRRATRNHHRTPACPGPNPWKHEAPSEPHTTVHMKIEQACWRSGGNSGGPPTTRGAGG